MRPVPNCALQDPPRRASIGRHGGRPQHPSVARGGGRGPAGRPDHRARADDGLPARRASRPDTPGQGGDRLRRRLDLREPHAVRAARGFREVSPDLGGGHRRQRRRRGGPGLRAGDGGFLRRRAVDLGRGDAGDPGTVWRVPAGPLPGRDDRGRDAFQRGAAGRRGLRAQGPAAARGDPPDGARPALPRADRGARDRARDQRSGAEFPQPLPRAGGPPGRRNDPGGPRPRPRARQGRRAGRRTAPARRP